MLLLSGNSADGFVAIHVAVAESRDAGRTIGRDCIAGCRWIWTCRTSSGNQLDAADHVGVMNHADAMTWLIIIHCRRATHGLTTFADAFHVIDVTGLGEAAGRGCRALASKRPCIARWGSAHTSHAVASSAIRAMPWGRLARGSKQDRNERQ